MLKEKFKSIMLKDIGMALERARNDERDKCNREKSEELESLRRRIEGEYTLKIKEKQSEVDSLNIRMKDLAGREKRVEEERHALREQALFLRRIMSDLKYLSEREELENLERGQTINRLLKEATEVDTKLLTGGI